MKKVVLFVILLFCSFYTLFAQGRLRFIIDKEGKLYAIPTEATYDIRIPEITYKSYIPITERYRRLAERYADVYQKYTGIAEQSTAFGFLPAPEADRPANMNTLSAAYRPFFNPYTSMFRSMNPMALDYDEYSFHPIDDDMLFIVNGLQETWPGAGGVNEVNLSFHKQMGASTLSAGAFGGRFYTPFTPNPAFFGGFNVTARYQATDWLAFRAWGAYTFYQTDWRGPDPFMVINPALNSTSVGGAVEFKIGDHAGFGIGVNYYHDPFRGKMRPQYIFYPAHTGTIFDKIGFQVN